MSVNNTQQTDAYNYDESLNLVAYIYLGDKALPRHLSRQLASVWAIYLAS